MPDGVNLDPNDPGINATVTAIPNSQWLVGWNDNPVFGDFDFNDLMFTLNSRTATAQQHSQARHRHCTTAPISQTVCARYRGTSRFSLLRTKTAKQFTLITGSGFRFDSSDRDSHMWAWLIRQDDSVVTPEPGTFGVACAAFCVLALLRVAIGRR
jgi:hypothetical protein